MGSHHTSGQGVERIAEMRVIERLGVREKTRDNSFIIIPLIRTNGKRASLKIDDADTGNEEDEIQKGDANEKEREGTPGELHR